jgi:hypothetical protein
MGQVSSEVKDKMINIGGNTQYLQVQHRVLWLRGQVGAAPDAQLVTEIVTLDVERQYAIVKAIVSIPNGGTATAHGSALASDLKQAQRAKFLEFAETRAVGRALAMLGYSTAGAQDLDEDGPDAPVDAPLQANGRQQAPQRPTAPNPARPEPAKPAQNASTFEGARGYIEIERKRLGLIDHDWQWLCKAALGGRLADDSTLTIANLRDFYRRLQGIKDRAAALAFIQSPEAWAPEPLEV